MGGFTALLMSADTEAPRSVRAEKGHQSRFSCPYHAWTYNNRGELVGIYGEETFGDVDRDSMGLTELACDESAGVIFVCLTPGQDI